MSIYDENQTPDEAAQAAADAAAAVADKGGKPEEKSLDQIALEAFSKGVEAADAGHKPDTDEIVADDQAGEEEEPELDADGNPIEKPKAEAKPADKAAPAAKPEAPKPDAAIEKEIGDLGLKGKTAERFRALSAEVKELAPLRDVVKELGLKTAEDVKTLHAAAERGIRFEETVVSTGASPEQFGAALGYLQLINTRDPAKMQVAYEAMQKEQVWLAKELGLAAPGVDPLADHPDLLEKVKLGKIDREDAEETAKLRAANKLRDAQGQKTEAQKQQERELAEAQQAGVEAIKGLAAKLNAADPVNFKARIEAMKPAIAEIQRTQHPSKWVESVQDLWIRTPAPAAPVDRRERTKVGAMPLRPTGAPSANVVAKPKDPTEAFLMGVGRASDQGGGY